MSGNEFDGKVVVVTGGGQGIGLCIARTFLHAGACVVIAEANGELERPACDFLGNGDTVLFVQTDVACENAVREMVQQAMQRFGRIDCLVNNAATACNLPIDQLTYEQWQGVLGVNLSGAFLCAKYCRPQLKENKGAIVNIASTRALMSEAHTEAYSATKAGLVGLTHALAVSLGSDVRVHCISPGWIVTDAYQHGRIETSLSQEDHTQHPAGRVGKPEDIAEMALFLCSEKSGFITGQNFIIDGGMSRNMIYKE